jgi:hypothetical protein
MIRKGLPLDRETWTRLSRSGDPPKPWCVEHEMEVPEFWQNPDLVEAEEEEELGPQAPWRPCGTSSSQAVRVDVLDQRRKLTETWAGAVVRAEGASNIVGFTKTSPP